MIHIQDFFAKAEYPKDDERAKQIAEVIDFMVDKGILKDLAYQRFINLMYQLRKVIFI